MYVVIWDLDDTLYHRHVQVGDDYSGIHDIVLFPDALPALNHADQIDILVTNETKKGTQDTKIDALGVREYFEEIHLVNDHGGKKDIFKNISESHTVPIYVIGDRIDNEIKYGNELGLKTILCRRGKYSHLEPQDEYEKPDFIIKDLTELDGIIRG